jgi:translocator protein
MPDHGWWPTIIAGGLTLIVVVVGGLLTEIGPWYRGLRMPSWKPPDWAFGPVWTVILTLCAWSIATAWAVAPDQATRTWIVVLFAINGVLHMAWSGLFFKLRRPDLALYEVAALWISIVAPALLFAAFSSFAALLLVPYVVWVAIAAYLNYEVVRLNRPFA